MNEPKGLKSARQAAEKFAEEQEKLKSTLDQAIEKAEREKRRILDFWEDLQTLFDMVKAYVNKEYRNVPWKMIILAIAAILYFLNPLDVIPDLIPSLGFLDDATVVAFVLNALKEELQNFKQFRGEAFES